MKKILLILLILSITSCNSLKLTTHETDYNDLKIIEITKKNPDTIIYNELRFYNKQIDSAYDTMKLMYLNFGNWNSIDKSSYMSNTNRKVWENIKLLENNQTFRVISDGTETLEEYFACLKVIDSEGKDCFKDGHPLKNKLINFFYNKMKETRKTYSKMERHRKISLNRILSNK